CVNAFRLSARAMVMVVMPSLYSTLTKPTFHVLRRACWQGSSRPYSPHQESHMQTRNPFIDDLTKMANGAMGALTGVKDEVEARIRDQIAKILDGMDIPRRDEFEAVKAMAAKAREENEELKKQIAELQARLAGPQS